MRELVTLACNECKRRNYTTKKNGRLHSGRVEFKKFCPKCNGRTNHKETR